MALPLQMPQKDEKFALPVAARRHPLVAEVAKRLHGACGVGPGDQVLVAVSGGADSTALLLACCAIAHRDDEDGPSLRVRAAHVNHHLRESAADDERHVADLCKQLHVELATLHVRPAELQGNRMDNARRQRYRALINEAARTGCRFIAAAHHADDQLETMLMALSRGTGLDGLAGMAWSRPADPSEQAMLVRPLLASNKAACEDLCRVAEVTWREDPTNADARYARARLRRDVLPVLAALWPGASERAAATADLLGAVSGLLEERLSQAFGVPEAARWDRAILATLDVSLIAAGLRRALAARRPDLKDSVGQVHLLAAAEAIADGERRPREFTWPGGVRVIVRSREASMEME